MVRLARDLAVNEVNEIGLSRSFAGSLGTAREGLKEILTTCGRTVWW